MGQEETVETTESIKKSKCVTLDSSFYFNQTILRTCLLLVVLLTETQKNALD
jgi:hypothetical protein